MDWFAIHTKPKLEEVAGGNVRQLGVEVFNPKLKQKKIIRRKYRTVIGPLFPGYFFACFDLARHYRAVAYAQGVRGVVTFGAYPHRVDPDIIESIRARVRDGLIVLHPFKPERGQVVRLCGGPFAGLEAVFERELSDSERGILLVKTLAYQARIRVPMVDVASL